MNGRALMSPILNKYYAEMEIRIHAVFSTFTASLVSRYRDHWVAFFSKNKNIFLYNSFLRETWLRAFMPRSIGGENLNLNFLFSFSCYLYPHFWFDDSCFGFFAVYAHVLNAWNLSYDSLDFSREWSAPRSKSKKKKKTQFW